LATSHKNKTLTTLLAALSGGIGLHRFYLHGLRDRFGWLHVLSAPLSLALAQAFPASPALFNALPLVLSMLCAAVEALVIGLTPDDKWDLRHNRHNAGSGRSSESHWVLAVILVLTAGAGAMGLIALLARSFDLLFTGGAFG